MGCRPVGLRVQGGNLCLSLLWAIFALWVLLTVLSLACLFLAWGGI